MGVVMHVKDQIELLLHVIKKQVHLKHVAWRQHDYKRAKQLEGIIKFNKDRLRELKRYGK